MRMAKASTTNTKRSSATLNRVVTHPPVVVMDEDEDFHIDGDDVIEPNFSIGDAGELCLEKVEGLLGIQTSSGKITLASCNSSSSDGASSDSLLKSNRKQIIKKKATEEKTISSLLTTRGGKATQRNPKVTLKAGQNSSSIASTAAASLNGLSAASLINTSGTNTISLTGIISKTVMKARPTTVTRQSAASASVVSATGNGVAAQTNQQVGSGGAQTPRTGTPSDHGATTPNPPTPGNTSSSGMVNSPHQQYVTITVDGEGGVVTEGGVNVGGTSSTYPVYNVGESSTMYTSGSGAQYYANSSTTSTVSYNQGGNVERDDLTDGSGTLTTAEINSILSGGSGDSLMSSSPEAETMHHQHHHHALIDGGVYVVPGSGSNNNNNSGASEGEGPSSLSHATRVSPTTPMQNRKRSISHPQPLLPPDLAMIQPLSNNTQVAKEEDTDDDEDDGLDFQDNPSSQDEGDLDSFLSDSDMKTLSKLYPGVSRSNGLLGMSQQKACPDTVQWLLDNYETAEGVSLPRSTLYNHYLRHCSDNKLDPVNAASFGKLIRSVFLGLRTRRLGTRGNSKYHYYGIRLKPTSPLNHLPEDFPHPSSAHGGGGHGNGSRSNSIQGTTVNNRNGENGAIPPSSKRLKTGKTDAYDGNHSNGFAISDSITVQQYLGDPVGALDDLPELDLEVELPEEVTEDDLVTFKVLYKDHCVSLLESLASFQLGQVESIWRFFWRAGTNGTISDTIADFEKCLPKQKLMLICGMKSIQDYVKEVDYTFYQKMVGILLPDVLRPIPSTMTQAIRNFAKSLENWLTSAMVGYPEEIVATKVSIVSALAQTLRRYTSLNHLAQAARAVLQNQGQITQMLSDLNRVDFHNVEEQASWVCGCNGDLVPNLEQDFKATLAQHQTLEQWATWLEGVVERVLSPHVDTPGFGQAAKHFILKWSFYSSLIIRDLTLRSAASFGSFHLLRLLYDEYIFYLVEHRVAQVSGVVPIAVIGKKSIGLPLKSDSFVETSSSGSPDSYENENGLTRSQISSHSSPSTSNPGETPQGIHSNNNLNHFSTSCVKPEIRRSKHFLTS